jgi:hypothetical protein
MAFRSAKLLFAIAAGGSTAAGSGDWHLLARQTGIPPEAVLDPDARAKAWASLNAGDPSAGQFGKLDHATIESFRQPDGAFTFKFNWPDGEPADKDAPPCGSGPDALGGTRCEMVWRQANHPLDAGPPAGLVVLKDVPTNPTPANQHFRGLVNCGGSAVTCNASPWWFCIGCPVGGGCPAGSFPGSGGCQKLSELHACGAAVPFAECLATAADGGGGRLGWQFVLAVLGGAAVYAGGGSALNRRRSGLSGAASLPHREFWLQMQGLVQDGVRFARTRSGLRAAGGRAHSSGTGSGSGGGGGKQKQTQREKENRREKGKEPKGNDKKHAKGEKRAAAKKDISSRDDGGGSEPLVTSRSSGAGWEGAQRLLAEQRDEAVHSSQQKVKVTAVG